MVKITLCMIVKNESKIIERCLDSCLPVIDSVSILDTGSTDNTVEIINDWCKRNNIPVQVHQEDFVNFAVSRSRSVELAVETFPKQPEEEQYLLLMDADFILVANPSDLEWKQQLDSDCYLVEQWSDTLRYWNVRLINTKHKWNCIGVTHEYWDAGVQQKDKLTKISIDDRGDGGCKADKFIRDERLLRAGIKDKQTPQDLKTRYMFYLGETLKNQGKFQQAIDWYEKRIQAQGWQEEVYFAMFQIGKCYQALDEQDQALVQFLNAWEYRPSRPEALYCATEICRKQSKNNLAFLFASQLKTIPQSNDLLFNDPRIHNYLADYELSITSFYVGKKQLGKEAIDRILARNDVPEHILKCCQDNLKYYSG